MTARSCTDAEFIASWEKHGSPTLVSKDIGLSVRRVAARRRQVEGDHGITLPVWNDISDRRVVVKHNEGRVDYNVQNGVVIVFSDGHFLPGVRTTAQRALVAMIKQLKPSTVICNGDAFDGGSISRYPRIGWDKKPTVLEELTAVEVALTEIEEAARGAHLSWPLGNHCSRFETRLAATAPQFEGVRGFTLKEHFPKWTPCWTVWVNDEVCITHFYHTGIHATHNNLMKGQCHYVTGHTHSLKVTPWTNARGKTLYGCDTGSLADSLSGHNSDYQNGRHGNHRSGFVVLTFKDGEMLMPELCQKWDEDSVQFRGHILDADDLSIVGGKV
jgi:hypothetical protein